MMRPVDRILSRISPVGLLNVFMLLIAVIYITYEVRSTAHVNTLHVLEPFADRVERLFLGSLRNTSYQLGYISKQISLEQARTEDVEQILHSFDQNEETSHGDLPIVPLIWMSPEDVVLVSTAKTARERPYTISLRDYIIKAKAHPFRMQIGKVRLIQDGAEGEHEKKILPIAMGVSGDRGTYLGSLISYIPLRELMLKITHALRSPELDFIIFDEDFDIVLESSRRIRLSDHPRLIRSLQELIIEGKKKGKTRSSHLLIWGDRVLVYKLSKYNHFSVVVTLEK